MENRDEYQAGLFSNRIQKRYRELRKWARRSRITCFRIYDRDIPEIPVSLDLYEFLPDGVTTPQECARFLSGQAARISANDPLAEAEAASRRFLVLCLYERPYSKPEAEERRWLDAVARAACGVFRVPRERVILKRRAHQRGDSQYEKSAAGGDAAGLVQEQGQLFFVDLTTYIDTGLFFDHRPLRARLRDTCGGRSVLNLFCYTGGFSVYAAQGGAQYVESVDLSRTYLAWAERNMTLNGFSDRSRYVFTRSDVPAFLNRRLSSRGENRRFDVIVLDPPTFSNSKTTGAVLDIGRQWPQLVNGCLDLLNAGGTLYFSTNSRRLAFDGSLVRGRTRGGLAVELSDITAETVPPDFAGARAHRCWMFRAGNAGR